MPKYKPIKIELNEQEDAEVYYQKVCGKNETVRRHARILYYAGQGTSSMNELCIVILLERQNNLKDLKSSRNSIIQRIVIMNMHSEPVLQGMPEIFNRIQFG